MVLDAEDRQPRVPEAFEGLVVEVDVARLDVGGQGGGVDGEAVVLGGDLDLAGALVADRVVGAAVAELELEGLGAEGLAQELVAQADAEDRDAARLGGGPDQGLAAWRSPRPAGAGSPGPFERKMPSGWCRGSPRPGSSRGRPSPGSRDSTRWRGMFHFIPKSSATTCGRSRPGVGASVPCRRARARTGARSPGSQVVASRGHDLARQVAADQAGAGLRLGHQAGVVEVGRREDALHAPLARGSGGPGRGCRSPRCR